MNTEHIQKVYLVFRLGEEDEGKGKRQENEEKKEKKEKYVYFTEQYTDTCPVCYEYLSNTIYYFI